MRFRVRYLNAQQQVAECHINAASTAAALEQVSGEGVIALGAHADSPPRILTSTRFDTPVFIAQLATLLGAGLGLVEALETLAANEPVPHRREVITALLRELRSGAPLSAALEGSPEHFPELLCACVRAAERTGDLPTGLARYGDYRGRSDALRRHMVTALLYPVIVLTVGVLVTGFLLVAVVPRFATLIAESGRQLPWGTQLLFDASTAIGSHPLLWLGSSAAVAAALALAMTDSSMRSRLARAPEQIPVVGGLLQRQRVGRFCRALALLLDGGIPLASALNIAMPLAGARTDSQAETLQAALASGLPLSEALTAVGLATPLSTRLLRAGERSGQLAQMLDRVAAFHDDEVARDVERIARVAEPLLMLGLGLMIGGVVLLLYLPIFDLAGGLQ